MTFYKLIDSLPLPSHTYNKLKVIYTVTICQYNEFMMKPTCGMRLSYRR